MENTILGAKIPNVSVFSIEKMILEKMTRKARSIEHAMEIKEKIELPFAAEIQSSFGATNSILKAFDIFNPLNMEPSLNNWQKRKRAEKTN